MDDQTAPTPRPLGIIVTSIALVLAVLVGIGVAMGASGDFGGATALAWIAIVGTAVTLVTGVAAVVLNRGRRWGFAAIILSLLVNPFLLTQLLAFFARLTGGENS